MWRQTGVKPSALDDLKELPAEMRYVWEYFLRINRRRSGNGFGVNPLSFSEIESFFRLNQIEYSPEEVSLIEILDDVALDYFAKESEKINNTKKKSKK